MLPSGRSQRKAFTLLELLIVVVILGILAAVVIPRLLVNAAEAKKVACAENRATINRLVEKWYAEKGVWPQDSLGDIAADPAFFPDGVPTCPVNGVSYTLNPATHRVVPHHHLIANPGAIERAVESIPLPP